MTGLVNRRGLITGAAATAVAAALPARVFAQPYSVPEQNRRILAVAKEQMERVRSVLWRTDVVGVADFALPSAMPRLHFADLEKGEVRSFLVAHGKGSDPEHDGFLKSFSNDVGSLATSRGAFITYEWYKGKYGTSIRLGGIDAENSNTLDRAIVMHPAWYANPDMISKHGKLGRSQGCFAVGERQLAKVFERLGPGRMIYAAKA